MLEVKKKRKARAMRNSTFVSFYNLRKTQAKNAQLVASRRFAGSVPSIRWK